MRNLPARLRPWLVAGLAVAAGLTLATTQIGTASAAPAKQWTAVELTDALLFNDGPAAARLTGLHRQETKWTDDLRDTRTRIDRAVTADRSWAQAFARNLQSGNPRQVTQGLGDLGTVVQSVVEAKYGKAAASAVSPGKSLSNANEQWARPVDLSRINSTGSIVGTIYIGDIGNPIAYAGAFTPGQQALQPEMMIAVIASGLRAGQ